MGKFDDQIAWCQEMIEEERKFLAPLEDGTMHLAERQSGDVEWTDTTQSSIARSRENIARLEKLVVKYEELNS